MNRTTKIVLWAIGTILVAVLGQVAIDLGDPTIPIRLTVAHALAAIATSVGALLVKLPQKKWTEKERVQKLDKQDGAALPHFLLGLLFVSLVGCGALGLNKPQTVGQSLVQAYGNANAATALIPAVLQPPAIVTPDKAQEVLDGSHLIRTTIEAYWDAAGLLQCKQTPVVEVCQGPDAMKVMATINAVLPKVTQFVLTYQGVKR